MKRFVLPFLSGFLLCAALAVFCVWEYDRNERQPLQSEAWYAHDDQTYGMGSDIELLNRQILATCNSIEQAYQGMVADSQIDRQNQLFDDVQLAKGVANTLANTTYDVALLRKLRYYERRELGYNLISDGFTVDIFVNAANLKNDNLIQVEHYVSSVPGMKQLLVNLRENMDQAHLVASRLKCERTAQPPVHLLKIP